MPKKSVKLSRREANYQSLKEWVKKKKIPRKFMFDITALLTLYQTGNIHNMNTVKNDINRLISVQKPETFLSKKLTNYINQEPVAVRIKKNKLLKTEFKILSNIMSFFTKTEQFDKRTGKPLKVDFTQI
jgi:hypothetical protein